MIFVEWSWRFFSVGIRGVEFVGYNIVKLLNLDDDKFKVFSWSFFIILVLKWYNGLFVKINFVKLVFIRYLNMFGIVFNWLEVIVKVWKFCEIFLNIFFNILEESFELFEICIDFRCLKDLNRFIFILVIFILYSCNILRWRWVKFIKFVVEICWCV